MKTKKLKQLIQIILQTKVKQITYKLADELKES